MSVPVDPVKPDPGTTYAPRKSWVPTQKWFVAQVIALAGIATSFIDSGWDDTETKLVIAWAVQALATYLVPNADTPGGVPLKR